MRLKGKLVHIHGLDVRDGVNDVEIELPPVNPSELKEGDTVLVKHRIEAIMGTLVQIEPIEDMSLENIVAVLPREVKEEKSCCNCDGLRTNKCPWPWQDDELSCWKPQPSPQPKEEIDFEDIRVAIRNLKSEDTVNCIDFIKAYLCKTLDLVEKLYKRERK